MKYIVLAKRFDDNKKEVVEYAAGSFDTIVNARLFQRVYEEHYSTTTRIYDIEKVMTV